MSNVPLTKPLTDPCPLKCHRYGTKTAAGTTQLIPFAVAEDSAFIPSVDNVEQYLGTASHAVPQNADSICLRIRMSSKEASSIAVGNTSLRVRVHYTINNTTTRMLAQWRFVSDHSLNKTFRLPARGLRGKQVKVFVSVLGLNRENSMLRASTASVYRSRPGSSPANKIAAEGTQGIPSEYTLGQNYPNPFNPSTQINYDLPELANVSLVVYDVLGRKVTELVNGTKEAGYHSTIWNASEVASGVYFARFTAADANGNVKLSKTRKLLLTK